MPRDYILSGPNQIPCQATKMLVGKEVIVDGEFRADSCHLRWRHGDDFWKRPQRPIGGALGTVLGTFPPCNFRVPHRGIFSEIAYSGQPPCRRRFAV